MVPNNKKSEGGGGVVDRKPSAWEMAWFKRGGLDAEADLQNEARKKK